MKLLSLFSGIGAFEKALENIGVDFELVNYCEIDKYASKSYSLIHNISEDLNLGDITKIDPTKLPKDIDLLTHGSPCLTGDTLILTKDGYKKLIDVKKDDVVLTHLNRYQKVINFFNQGKKETYKLKAMPFDELNCTSNHKFYVREKYRKYPLYKREFKNPIWKECSLLTKNDYVGVPINQNEIMPKWDGVVCHRGNSSYIKNNLDISNKKLWYLCGRYVADGWIRYRKERNDRLSSTIICCGKHKLKDFESKIENYLHYSLIEDRTTYRLSFLNIELANFLFQFGHGAKNKYIPGFMFDMPIDYIKSFLEGYFDGDGCIENNIWSACSISKNLMYGIAKLIEKAYKRPVSIYKLKKNSNHIIEGRLVHQNDIYQLRFKNYTSKFDKAFYENNYIWYPIKSIEKTNDKLNVYDIEVENDHSFIANGIITHNCQSFSLAGKQAGGDKGSGTASSLMWYTVDIIKEIKPKIIIWENVKNLLSQKHRHNFDAYVQILNEYGYNSYFKVLNTKNYGIPQNRERVFTISIRKDIDNKNFEFPQPFELITKLRDLLEENVDEKYYVSDKMMDYLTGVNQKESKFPRGDRFKEALFSTNYKNIAGAITTCNGSRPTDNYIIEGELKEINLKDDSQLKLDVNNSNDFTIKNDDKLNELKIRNDMYKELRIRKLTPKECFRLQGFDDKDADICLENGISKTQLYKQAGNSISVNVLEFIYLELMKVLGDIFK